MAVRREKVILSLESNITTQAAKDAAAIALLHREINALGGPLKSSETSLFRNAKASDEVGSKAEKAGNSIDKLSGRISLLAQVSAILGPAFAPIGAVAIPALTGIASSMGFAALAAGTTAAAFQGVGDALDAMNKAHLNPTTENLDAARQAMANISPEARDLVRNIRSLLPELRGLRDVAAGGMFPGLNEGIDSLEKGLPKIERIVAAVSGELGDLAAESGASLAGPRWDEFFTYVADEAPKALSDMAHGVGNVTHALAQLMVGFAPLSSDFSTWLVDSTRDLDEWATGLDKTQGFQDFVDYVRTNGPQVEATVGAIGNAILQMVQAASPLGGPVLKGLEVVADVIGAIADSDLGTPIFTGLAALSLYNRALAVTAGLSKTAFGTAGERSGSQSLLAGQLQAAKAIPTYRQFGNSLLYAAHSHDTLNRSAASTSVVASTSAKRAMEARAAVTGWGRSMAPTAIGAAGLVAISSGLTDTLGLTNTATLALAGSMAGPWGAALGGAAGLAMDVSRANQDVATSLDAIQTAVARGDLAAASSRLAELKARQKDVNSVSGIGDFFSDIGKSGGASLLQGLGSIQVDGIKAAEAAVRGLKTEMADTAPARRLAAEITAAKVAAGQTARSFITLGGSLNDSKVSLNGWIHDLQDQNRALLNFGRNAQTAANKGLRDGLIRQLQQAGPEGALRMRQLANGSQTQIARANRAFATGQRAVRTYTDAMGRIPTKKKTDVNLTGTEAAQARIARLQASINRLHGTTVTNTIRTIHTSSGPVSTLRGGGRLATSSADGSTVPKTGLPYADRHLYLLADGEEVISNRYGQADRHRDLLKAINANRMAGGGTVGRLAAGGTARRRRDRSRRGHSLSGGARLNALAELRDFREALRATTKTVDRERTAREDLAQRRSQLASSVSGSFTSDLFSGGNVWAAGGGDPLSILKADIAKAQAFKATLAGLSKQGLNGDALAAIASTGDVGKANALAATGVAGVGQYESLFNQRAAAAKSVGDYAGAAAYRSEQIAANKTLAASLRTQQAQTRAIQHLTAELKNHPKRTGHEVGKAVNGAAAKGHRSKRGNN